MNCTIRKWDLEDAKALSEALSNPKIQDNLRDGLPYPYTEQDGQELLKQWWRLMRMRLFRLPLFMIRK